MFKRIRHMVIKEFLQVFRHRRLRFYIIAPPVIQLFLFGYVVTTDVKAVSTAFYDLDNTRLSRELGSRLEAGGYFRITERPHSAQELRDLLDRGKVLVAIQVGEGFGRDLLAHRQSPVQVLVDGTDSNTALIALNYATRIISDYALDLAGPEARAALERVEFKTRLWYNPELKSRNFNVPGVMASIAMLAGLMLTALSVVREREVGTMEQLMVTPLRPVEMMLGKTLPFAIIGYAQMCVVITVGTLWFDIPIRGSLWLLGFSMGLYLLSVLGMGLFISTVSRTQQQALMAALLFLMPAMMLSGFVFPIENMPVVFQYMTYLNPLRYFLKIIRGIFLKGNGIEVLWPQMAALAVLGVSILAVSASRFRKRME